MSSDPAGLDSGPLLPWELRQCGRVAVTHHWAAGGCPHVCPRLLRAQLRGPDSRGLSPFQAGALMGVELLRLAASDWTGAHPHLGTVEGAWLVEAAFWPPGGLSAPRGPSSWPGDGRPGIAQAHGRCPCSGNPADPAQGSECVNKVLCTVSSLSLQGTGLAGGGGPPTWAPSGPPGAMLWEGGPSAWRGTGAGVTLPASQGSVVRCLTL